MQKTRRVVVCITCLGIVLISVLYFGYRSRTYFFAGAEIRDATIMDTMAEYMLKYKERKALSKILRNMQVQKVDSEILLHSSRTFQIETEKTIYEITLYGKVGEDFLCAIDQERYRMPEDTYYELENLYDYCFRKAHEELFEGFPDSKIVRITSGVGRLEREFSESEIEEAAKILRSMSILGKAEDYPTTRFLGVGILKIETEKDYLVLDVMVPDGEWYLGSFNGSMYRVDNESGKRLAEMTEDRKSVV